TDTEGRQVQLGYTSGALTQIALPDGSLWRFAYANGELAQIFDPIHTASTPWRTFEYQPDTRGVPRLLTAMRDDAGKLLEGHAYDGSGNLIRRTEAAGTPRARTTTMTYGYAAWPWFVTQMTETSAAKPGTVKVITNTWNTTGAPETTLTSTVSGYLGSGDSAP